MLKISEKKLLLLIFLSLPVSLIIGGLLGVIFLGELGINLGGSISLGMLLALIAWYFIFNKISKDFPEDFWILRIFRDPKRPGPNTGDSGVEIQTGQNESIENVTTIAESTVKIREEPFTPEDEKLFKEFKEKHEFVAHSHAMLAIFKKIKEVAEINVTVLITGESGTGKELVAKAIQRESDRKDKPFKVVNSGAIPQGTIESELFGYKEGSHSTAKKDQDGYFTKVNSGTLFLDEVGELELKAQVKLLRVIECGEFHRVGDPETIKVDVRVITATNRNLHLMKKNGDFRSDLYSRIEQVQIQMPNIAKRKNDIPLIAVLLFKLQLIELLKLSKDYELKSFMKEPKTFDVLKGRKYEENVRSLKNHLIKVIVKIKKHVHSINEQIFQKVLLDPDVDIEKLLAGPVQENGIFKSEKYIEALNKYIENGYDMTAAAKQLCIDRGTQTARVFSAVLRLSHHVSFELSKIPDILNEYGIIVKDDEIDDLLKNINGILVKIIKQTIKKTARKAYKPEDEELYRSLIETRPDLVDCAKNK